MHAKAQAQAAEALEEAARTLKRHQNAVRTAIQLVRQAQANLIGVEVETVEPITKVEGGQGVSNENGIR